MRQLRAWRDLLRDPLATSNREALGFALLFYGGIAALLCFAALAVWLLLR